jgi:uncharacterized protein (DUF1501 family)
MNRPKLTRRSFGIGALAASLCAFGTAAGAAARKRFLFVHATGGWDPLCVFAPLFGAPSIQMEPDAAPMTAGGLSLVDGPGRPAVRTFFERFGARTLVVNGLSTRSVNHLACMSMANTGSLSDDASDWATLLALADADAYYLPHLVLDAPSFVGEHAVLVAHGEGRLEQAVHGTLLEASDTPVAAPIDLVSARVDRHLAARASDQAKAATGDALRGRYEQAALRAQAIVGAKEKVMFAPAFDLQSRAENAIRLLASGVSRCASLSTGGRFGIWDTHDDNAQQAPLFEALFTDLAAVLDRLEATQTADGARLADEAVVVVISEMGRTPAYNATMGRDHWPFTTALVIGPGVTGGRTVGAFTDGYVGIGVDPATGELDPSRAGIDARSFGATLLALGGADPAVLVPGAEPIVGVLA